jgi:hypothetical protein
VQSTTIGAAAKAGVRLIVWCKKCGHQLEPDPAEMAARLRREPAGSRLAEAADLFAVRAPGCRHSRDRNDQAVIRILGNEQGASQHEQPERNVEAILNDLYASEINASISWIWDGGFYVTIGYREHAESWAFRSIGGAAEWLRDQACLDYADSEFARKYAQTQRGWNCPIPLRQPASRYGSQRSPAASLQRSRPSVYPEQRPGSPGKIRSTEASARAQSRCLTGDELDRIEGPIGVDEKRPHQRIRDRRTQPLHDQLIGLAHLFDHVETLARAESPLLHPSLMLIALASTCRHAIVLSRAGLVGHSFRKPARKGERETVPPYG